MIIALSGLLITTITLIVRKRTRGATHELRQHVEQHLPKSINELALFLAAGVLAVGIDSVLKTGAITLPINSFDVYTAIQLLGILILVAACGVHPVIMISGFTPLVMTLNPDQNLLALTYMFSWSLGVIASPLSGTHLVIQGRYSIPSWRLAIGNWGFAFTMYIIASGWLLLVGRYFLE